MTDEKITIEDFMKIDLRVGKILHAEEVEDSRKMLKLEVDIGDQKRIIYAGVKKSYSPDDLINRLVVVIANLMPREMKFGTSSGMVLAADSDGNIIVLELSENIKNGSKVK